MTLRLKRSALLLLASWSLFGSGCSWFVAQRIEQGAQTLNADPGSTYVHRPDLLQKVRKIVVPDFRVKLPAGQRDKEVMYPGSAAAGTLYFANDSFGVALAEFFEEELLKAPGLEVVERNQLQHLMAEQNIQMSGLTDGNLSPMGRISGADSVLLGTVNQAYNYWPNDPLLPTMTIVGLHLRLVDLATGRIILVHRDRQILAAQPPDENKLLQSMAHRFVDRLTKAIQHPATGTVLPVAN